MWVWLWRSTDTDQVCACADGVGWVVIEVWCGGALPPALAHQVLRFTHPSVAQEEVVHAFG